MALKRFLALGSGTCLFQDIDRALALSEYEGVVAANEAGVAWSGSLTSWVSLHPDQLAGRLASRRMRGYPDPEEIVGHLRDHEKPGSKDFPAVTAYVPYKFPGQTQSGSSGLFAVKRAIDLGATHVVCCGIPLESCFGRIDGKDCWPNDRVFKSGWEQAAPAMAGRVRSMSGWTRRLLGEPTAEWLNGSREP